jgi:hypothetical protein
LHEIIWNRLDVGLECLELAKQRKAIVEQSFLRELVAQLILIRLELGPVHAKDALVRLEEPLRSLAGESAVSYLYGYFAFNFAFNLYHAHKYQDVTKELVRAVKYQPGFLANKGFYAVMAKSLFQGKSTR